MSVRSTQDAGRSRDGDVERMVVRGGGMRRYPSDQLCSKSSDGVTPKSQIQREKYNLVGRASAPMRLFVNSNHFDQQACIQDDPLGPMEKL